MKLLPESFKMRIAPLAGTIKRVVLHSEVSHHLFERKDCGKILGTSMAFIIKWPKYHKHWRNYTVILLRLLSKVYNIDDITSEWQPGDAEF